MKKIILISLSVLLAACSTLPKSQVNLPAAKANVVLALAYYQAGDVISAEKTIKIAQSEAPQKAFVWYSAAYMYEMQKKYNLADQYFCYAMTAEPSSLTAKQNYAVFLCRQKKYNEAMRLFDAVIKNKSNADISLAIKNRTLCYEIRARA